MPISATPAALAACGSSGGSSGHSGQVTYEVTGAAAVDTKTDSVATCTATVS